MYQKRLKICIIVASLLFAAAIFRLVQLQLLTSGELKQGISQLLLQRKVAAHLGTIRGNILDRNDNVIATDVPKFTLSLSYQLLSALDERVMMAELAGAEEDNLSEVTAKQLQKLEHAKEVINKCAYIAASHEEIIKRIESINNDIWNKRTFQAWRKNCTATSFYQQNKDKLETLKISAVTKDFKKEIPDANERLKLIMQTNIAEMHNLCSILSLDTEEKLFNAQIEFLSVEDVEINTQAYRYYPYGRAASHVLGWVGLANVTDEILAEKENMPDYRPGELCGKEDGIEYVCEPLLRGKPGKIFTDIAGEKVETDEAEFGEDIKLTLDIKLQEEIRDFLTGYDPNLNRPVAVAIIDVQSSDILVLLSLPDFNSNDVRYDYNKLLSDPRHPLINRAINEWSPPGSVIKPLILTAGLETNKIQPGEVISCPSESAREGWPNCWIYNEWGIGHDTWWQNNARNAIKGSCNVYFSRLVSRLDTKEFQGWLRKFGYGKYSLPKPLPFRNFRQLAGAITSPGIAGITKWEYKFFGIGQGNLRVTPLQVANAMAVIARGGIYKNPMLFFRGFDGNKSLDMSYDSYYLNISQRTLNVLRDGMYAVVNESRGTAHTAFEGASFPSSIRIYGKTGSTEAPENAWFAGFAEARNGSAIALSILVEGGQSGARDVAPVARKILEICVENGYLRNR